MTVNELRDVIANMDGNARIKFIVVPEDENEPDYEPDSSAVFANKDGELVISLTA